MIKVQLFGPVSVEDGAGRTLHSILAQPKRLALLIYLILAGRRAVQRDALIGLFWPDSDEEHARNSLSQVLTYLRRALGEDVFLTANGGAIAINAEMINCDAVDFDRALAAQHLEEGVSLYGGYFLDGFFVSGAPAVERWIDEKRTSYCVRAMAAFQKLSELAESQGNTQRALQWAKQAMAVTPHNEAGLRRVLTLLDELGEIAEAISLYRTFALNMAVEFDLQPSAETQRYIGELQSREMERPAADFAAPRPGEGVPPIPSTPSRWRGRRAVALVAVLAGLAVVYWLSRRSSSLDHQRVLIAPFENQTGDAALDLVGDIAADWITRGLQQTGIVDVIDPRTTFVAAREMTTDSADLQGFARVAAMARATHAEIAIWGAYHQRGDSLFYRAQITDTRKGRRLFSLDPIATSRSDPTEGAEVLRARVAGAIAALLGEQTPLPSAFSGRPPKFEAYREYMLGLERFQQNAYVDALRHFRAAALIDTSFSTPLIWSAFAYGNMAQPPQVDSIVGVLAARRDRLAPLEQYALAYFQAQARSDVSEMLDAAQSAAQLSPGSEWSYNAARLSLAQNHPRDALRYGAAVNPEYGWAKGWAPYWGVMTTAHHLLEQYQDELRVSARAIAISPDIPFLRTYEIRALIALGRVAAARESMERMILLPARAEPPGQLLWPLAQEFWVHGHRNEAVDIWRATSKWSRSEAAELFIQSQQDTADARRTVAHNLARGLYSERRDEEARAIYEAIAAQYPRDPQARLYLAYIAARRRDHVTAAQRFLEVEDASSAATRMRLTVPKARIDALSGNVEQAMQLLRDFAPQNMDAHFFAFLHRDPDWDVLREFAPFKTLLRPHAQE